MANANKKLAKNKKSQHNSPLQKKSALQESGGIIVRSRRNNSEMSPGPGDSVLTADAGQY